MSLRFWFHCFEIDTSELDCWITVSSILMVFAESLPHFLYWLHNFDFHLQCGKFQVLPISRQRLTFISSANVWVNCICTYKSKQADLSLIPCTKKSSLILCTKTISKSWAFKVRKYIVRNYKAPKKNIRKIYDIAPGNDFIDMTTEAKATTKISRPASNETTIPQRSPTAEGRQPTGEEKMLTDHVSGKVLIW